MSKDILLSSNHDLVFEDFDLKFTYNAQILPQKIKQALLMFQGEWFLDVDSGVPYFKDVLGQKGALDSVRAVFIEAINNVKEVKSLLDFNMYYSNIDRSLKLTFTVSDDYNNYYEIELNV